MKAITGNLLNESIPSNQSLEIYYDKSNKWLSEIDYWRDELCFLFKANQRIGDSLADENQRLKWQALNEKINIEFPIELNYLRNKLREIKGMFATLIRYPYVLDEQKLVREFRFLATRVKTFRILFKSVKKDLFQLVKAQKKAA